MAIMENSKWAGKLAARMRDGLRVGKRDGRGRLGSLSKRAVEALRGGRAPSSKESGALRSLIRRRGKKY